ncbi:MAG: hypothetical protein ACKOCT_21635, partial [Alphaproteobacteria bacterium]
MKSSTHRAILLAAAGVFACATAARADLPQYPCNGTEPTCNGLTPTICGTAGDDTIIGTSKADVIVGQEGNDYI